MIKLYLKEGSDEYWGRSFRQVLSDSGIRVTFTQTIDTEDDSLYLLLGSEYLISRPKRYIVIQTLATSPHTLKSGIDAYWMTEEYLKLLRNAEAIWDCNQSNVEVWKKHYHCKQVYHVPFGYTGCLTVPDNTQGEQTIVNTSDNAHAIFVGGKRASQFTNKMNEVPKENQVGKGQKPTAGEKKYHIQYENSNDVKDLITRLRKIGKPAPPIVLISDFPDTQPNLPLIYCLRYNGFSCLVEKSRDASINSQCESLGCSVVPFIRLQKQLSKILREYTPTTKAPPKENWKQQFPPEIIKSLEESVTNKAEDSLQSNRRKKKRGKSLNLYYRNAIPMIEHELLVDGGISLKLGDVPDSDLPFVSVCTPTGNRRWIFCLAIRNFLSIMYPRDKLEWVILDDGEKDIQDIIPKDKSVHYEFIGGEGKERMSVAQKRNELVKRAKGEIIVFMDDDDFYLGESVLARVKSLLKYKNDGVRCVGCSEVASYDLQHGYAAICSNGESYLTESSMAFTRDFWEERPFQEVDRASEYRYFLEYRQSQIRTLPFQFITVALTHGQNTTGDVRSLSLYKKWQPSENWEATKEALNNIFDEETQQFLSYLKKMIPPK